MDIMEMLASEGRRRGRDRADDAPKSPPDVLCKTLREIAARYSAPCPFKVGDLVTPRKGYVSKEEGEPGIVIEVAEQPIRNFACVEGQTDIASMAYGAKIDVRVAYGRHGVIMAHWQESWTIEPYTGPGADAA